jgi:lysophospholipase L1-like esterase
VDLVGPYDALTAYHGGPEEYVDADFDRDHAAVPGRRWATTLTAPDVGPDAVATMAPDVVVIMLGVNDLVFGQSQPGEIRDMAATWIRDVQAADPDIDVVLAEMTPIAWADVTATNALLADLPAELTTDTSAVVLARTSAGYTVEADTNDYVHPAASGEVKIAAAVSDALFSLGVGSPASRPLPAVPQGPRLVPELQAAWSTSPDGSPAVHATWVPHGADAAYVWVRPAGTTGWQRLPGQYTGDEAWLDLDRATAHDVMVQPVRGLVEAADDVRSNVVRVPGPDAPAPPEPDPTQEPTSTPAPDATAAPDATSAPTPPSTDAPSVAPVPAATRPGKVVRVRTSVRADRRVVVRWRAAEDASRYRVVARRSGTTRWVRFDRSTARRLVLGPLLVGRYAVRVVSYNDVGRARGSVHRFRVPS